MAASDVDILQEPIACSASLLTPSACRGPWAYHPYVSPCYVNKTDPACPNKVAGQCHPKCQHAQIGATISRTEPIRCLGHGGCGAATGAEADCRNRTNGYYNATAGNLANVIPSHIVSGLSVFEHGQYDANCIETLQNAADGVDDACLPTSSCTLDGACRLESHGAAPAGDCGWNGGVWAATDSGLAPNRLSMEHTGGLYVDSCSTLEDHTVNAFRLELTMARVSADNMYWAVVPMPASQASAARHDLIKEAKLMFELGIAPKDSSALHQLYDTAPVDEFDCGVSARAPVSASCAAFGTTNHLDGPLGLCQRMLSTHVADTVFQAELAGCLDLLGRPELQGTGACAVEYRNLAETVEERLLAKALVAIKLPAGSTVLAGLGTTLSQIDRWYTGAAQSFASDPAGLSDATGRVLKSFWSRVYDVSSPVTSFAGGNAGTDTAKTQLANLFSARIDTDRQVLAAAFANPAPLDEVPLLLIIGDALSALRERLVTAAPLYDLACRFKGACSPDEANEATRLLRLIGALGDDAALGDALAAGTTVRAPWRDLFTSVRAARGALETAYRKATSRSDASLSELYLTNVVGPAAVLAEQVSTSHLMWTSYASHGVLLPGTSVLRTSLTGSNVTAALASFQGRRGALTGHRTDYQRNRGDLAQTVLNRITNKQFQDRVNDEAAVLKTDYDNVGRDLDGLMAAQDQAEQQLGKFMATYLERASSPGWLPQYPIQGHPGSLAIDATSAKGNGSLATDIPAVAVRDPQQPAQPWHLDVGAGDMLSFDVQNTWSPTCALRKTTLSAPRGTLVFNDPTHLQIGPEGFSIVWQNDHFEAKDHVSSDFSSSATTTSICGSVSGGLGGAAGPVFGSISASASVCQTWTTGHSDTDSTSNGNKFQSTASFSGGLRVPRAPFPSFPAGALLLVEVIPDGAGTRIRDAHVVRSRSSFTFPVAASLYLVTNDERDPVGCASIDTSPLAVTYVHGQSVEVAARRLAQTMATILTDLTTAKATYVAQGSVTSTELSSLQTAAYDRLRASCGGCNLGAFPEEVRGMFDAWLGVELAAIERQTRIVAAVRALDSLVLKLKGLQDDLAGAQDSSRVLGLLTYWQLGNLAYHLEDPQPALRTSAELLLESANDMLALMNLLYPQSLIALRQSTGPITGLRTFDWMLPYDEQVQPLETLTEVVQARIEDARNAGGLSTAPVVVVFPKPGSPAPDVPGSVTASPERAAAVWEACGTAICLKRKPTFNISAEDVYGRPLVGLGCLEAAPVVQAFAVVAINNGSSGNDDWNNNVRRADIFRSAEMQFPTESGLRGYRTDGPGGVLTPTRVRVLATDHTSVATTFNALVRTAGGDLQGVSPFNSFTLDLGADVTNVNLPLKSATAMVVIFDAQTRTTSGPLAGIGVCAQPLASTLAAGRAGMSPPACGDLGSGPGGSAAISCVPVETAQ